MAGRRAVLEHHGTRFPRGSARSLLITVLGELAWPSGRPIRTSTILHIMTSLGVEEQTVRQALARAATSDWILAERQGREVSWTLSPTLVAIFEAGSARVYSLSDPYSSWDGSWLVLLTTIPQSHRAARRPMYAGLSWAGLGNPAPGVWLSPHVERAEEVRELIDRHGLRERTICFIGALQEIGVAADDVVERGWDLSALHQHYEQLLADIGARRPHGGDQTLLAHIELISQWRQLPRTDPQLPEALLPDWIGRRVARRIEALRAQWAPAVRARYEQLDGAPG